jgi:lysozyme family protein
MLFIERLLKLNKSLAPLLEQGQNDKAVANNKEAIEALQNVVQNYLQKIDNEALETAEAEEKIIVSTPRHNFLSSSVGISAKNKPKDVCLAQELLEKHKFNLSIDGCIGPKTIAAIKGFQTSIGFRRPDGCIDPGGRTWKALIEVTPVKEKITKQEGKGAQVVVDKKLPKTWDSHSNRRITTLDSRVQASAIQFINETEADLGIQLRVTDALRTVAEQDKLYKGGKVTKVRGGRSYHNYGLAIDVVEIKNGKALYSSPNWKKIAAIGKRIGFEWGGDWKSFVDKPHFQMTFGLSTLELMKNKYPKLYEERYGAKHKAKPKVEKNKKIEQGTDLLDSVGKGGTNNPADVKKVQTALAQHDFGCKVDGDCGTKTLNNIVEFQRLLGFRKPDGCVDPNGRTWEKLKAPKFNAENLLKEASEIQLALVANAIKSEGTYNDDPNDSGGKTMYGIAENYEWPKFARLFKIDSSKVDLIQKITKEQASAYYLYSRYEKYGLDTIKSKRIANAFFDQSILTPNFINKHARRALKALGYPIAISNKKLDAEAVLALNEVSESAFIKAFVAEQNTYYEDVAKSKPKKAKFLRGWKNRTARL